MHLGWTNGRAYSKQTHDKCRIYLGRHGTLIAGKSVTVTDYLCELLHSSHILFPFPLRRTHTCTALAIKDMTAAGFLVAQVG